ncbi:class I SAM-dependent methyltransferase [Streptomyces sp. NPDC051243]|uniref:class I SAM-dependent methyltransferase n=1 Tax=Streptomyces sp. NPDC051243 TaxID=3365646 RepID=UPI0037B686B6
MSGLREVREATAAWIARQAGPSGGGPCQDTTTDGPARQPVAGPGTDDEPPLVPADAGTRTLGPFTPGPRSSATHPAPDRTWSADPYAHALRTGQGPLFLRRADGWLLPLDVERWCAAVDAADLEVLRRCEGAVLDVGCGPGRMVAALARQGRQVLGIDVSEAAVARTVRLGGPALRRSVFDPLPGEGRWGTALLMDGNVGIGGDPAALLDRMAQLLARGGLLIAETVPDLDLDERVQVHVTDARGAPGAPFPWARLGTPALLRHAERAGWSAVDRWTAGGRSFAALRSRQPKSAF